MSTTSFAWPEFYSFPPFFTLQQNEETRMKQIDLWCDLVISYCQHHKLTNLTISEASKMDLFNNTQINRQLDEVDIPILFEELVNKGYGTWVTPDKTIFAISGRKVADIANDIYKWADSIGLINNISTIVEIATGPESRGEIFHGYPYPLIYAALKALSATDRAVLIEGGSLEDLGVKFLAL